MADGVATESGTARIADAFAAAKEDGRAALMPYLMGGFPDQAMATAVQEAFEAGVRKLGAQARRHAEQQYSWDHVVAGLLQHYQAVLGHQPQVRAHG